MPSIEILISNSDGVSKEDSSHSATNFLNSWKHRSKTSTIDLIPETKTRDIDATPLTPTESPHTTSTENVSDSVVKNSIKSNQIYPSAFSSKLHHLAGWIWSDSPYSGLACMALSSLSYSFMSLTVKLLTVRKFPCFQMLMLRSFIISCLSAIVLKKRNIPLLGNESQRNLMLLRSFVGFIAVSCFFYSLQTLTLSDATVLNFTSPIFTAIFAKIFLKENFSNRDLIGSVFSFLGVIMVARPILFTQAYMYLNSSMDLTKIENFKSKASFNDMNMNDDNNNVVYLFGILIALLAAATGGIAFCLVRFLGKAGEHPLVTVFTFSAFSLPSSALLLFLLQKPLSANFFEFLGMICVGLFAFIAQIFLTRGLQLEKAGKATSMKYVKVVCTYVFGVFLLHEIPSLVGLVGAFFIVLSSSYIVLGKTQ